MSTDTGSRMIPLKIFRVTFVDGETKDILADSFDIRGRQTPQVHLYADGARKASFFGNVVSVEEIET